MSVNNFKELKEHLGHKIDCVGYGNPPHYFDDKKPISENVAIECNTCNEVLIDFDSNGEIMYCENCQQENLKDFYIDSMGSVFCSKKCFLDSKEYREVDISTLTLVKGD